MNRILEVDAGERVAWVEPGVLNLDLSRAVAHLGLHYAPDPSSQQACTIGGNVATNAGGPHCLASGVTAAHVLAVDVVLPDGSATRLGGLEPDQPGYDLRVLRGERRMMGAALYRGTGSRQTHCWCGRSSSTLRRRRRRSSGIISSGIVPAALEMMDAEITRAVEDYVGAGYPRDAAAVLLVELDGLEDGVSAQVDAVASVGREHSARSVRVEADEAERALLWKGRKSAFKAIARIAPDYYRTTRRPTHPSRRGVAEGLCDRGEHSLTMMNVFHAVTATSIR
jgi:glycolate oxidase